MIESIRQDILHILEHGLKALQIEDVKSLRELSNSTIHNASIYQEENSIAVAVIFYTLFKVYGRPDYKQYKNWKKFTNNVYKQIKLLYLQLQQNNIKKYTSTLHSLLNFMSESGDKLRVNIQQVIYAAKIHKASRLHEHGISIGRTAQLLNISPWELMEYTGRTGIADTDLSMSLDIKKRLALTRKLFS